MARLYSFALYLLLPFALLRLLLKGIRAPAYLRRWGERFGYFPVQIDRPSVWLHAVSVGEAIAAFPLIETLQARHPELPIVVTTTTPTGSERVVRRFGGAVAHGYLPYDMPAFVGRFLERTRPRLAIIMETEIWPNLYAACTDRGIPIVLVNARLSERSAAGYARLGGLTRDTLHRITRVCAQTEADASRFRALGAPAVEVAGNIKFDVRLPSHLHDEAARLRAGWGRRAVWIAASTHEGEDEQVLAALAHLRAQGDRSLLVLVPRHPERFERVAALCEARGYRLVRRSRHQPAVDADIFLGDTMGELLVFYAASDIAFVGGSLIASGGHNMLEPAALGLPVLSGPHVFNFEEVNRLLLEAGASVQVNDASSLAEALRRYLADEGLRRDTGARGRKVVEVNRGALNRLVSGVIEPILRDEKKISGVRSGG